MNGIVMKVGGNMYIGETGKILADYIDAEVAGEAQIRGQMGKEEVRTVASPWKWIGGLLVGTATIIGTIFTAIEYYR